MASFFGSWGVFDVHRAYSVLSHTTVLSQAKACIVVHWSGFIIIDACSALSHSVLINIGGGELSLCMADLPKPSTGGCGSYCLPTNGLKCSVERSCRREQDVGASGCPACQSARWRWKLSLPSRPSRRTLPLSHTPAAVDFSLKY